MENIIFFLIIAVVIYVAAITYLINKRQDEISEEIKRIWDAIEDQKEHVNKIDTATFFLSTGEDGDFKLVADQ